MTVEEFRDLLTPVAERAHGQPLDKQLEAELNTLFPPDSPVFDKIRAACSAAIAAGWMCNREAGGIKFGRVIRPARELHGFSVDVVEMNDIKGPHHRHPNGEIDMIMPLTPNAKFDGHGAGWLVYSPDTAHYPTVSDGKALVLYLLPQGAIEFTKAS